jgi:predicted SAM-dependent methyltransferase
MSMATKAVGAARRVEKKVARAAWYRRTYTCPICGYVGPFASDIALTGRRPRAQCPSCWCSERHRTQALVMDILAEKFDFASMSMLHVSPERFLAARFREEFGTYTSSQYEERPGIDLVLDLTACDLPDESFDVVYASHVLEHIPDDRAAAETIHRLLTPGGFAVLPVPIVCLSTVEFPRVVDTEYGHVRGPGPDYFDRFADLFDVDRYTSDDLDDTHQVWVYENRSRYPTTWAPYRTPSAGRRHRDIVPILTKRSPSPTAEHLL